MNTGVEPLEHYLQLRRRVFAEAATEDDRPDPDMGVFLSFIHRDDLHEVQQRVRLALAGERVDDAVDLNDQRGVAEPLALEPVASGLLTLQRQPGTA